MNKDREMNLPYRLWPIDPYLGSELAGRVEMQLFEFSTPYFQDVLEAMRKDSNRWSVIKEIATDEYWQHIDGDEKVKIVNKKTGFTIYEWQRRNSRWPDHLRLCEVHQLALAAFYELYKLE